MTVHPYVTRSYVDRYNPVYWNGGHYFSFGHRRTVRGKTRRVWRFDILGFLFDGVDGLFRGCFAWDASIGGSYPDVFRSVWDNVCTFMTPFYRPRRALLAAICNYNGSKLLTLDRKSAFVRNREADCVYVSVRCGWFRAEARRVRYVDSKGCGVCTFLHGTEDTIREEKVLARGRCLTWKQCELLFDRIRLATPELDWETKE